MTKVRPTALQQAATASLPNVNDIIAKRGLALLGHVVRLDAHTPAQQILKHGVDVTPNDCWTTTQLLATAD